MRHTGKWAFFVVLATGSALASAEQVTVTGVYAGQPGTGPIKQGPFVTSTATSGYLANDPTKTYLITGATITGGKGMDAVGTSPTFSAFGEIGASGLHVVNAATTIQSGTFVGGQGGSAAGVAPSYYAGEGGPGFFAEGTAAAPVVINGGTFRPGDYGVAIASATNPPGINGNLFQDAALVTGAANLTINGGSFFGVNASPAATGGGAAMPAVFVLDGTTTINGGTFTPGTPLLSSTPPVDALDVFGGNSKAVLNGTDFAVNGVPVGYGAVVPNSGVITGRLVNNGGAVSTLRFSRNIFGIGGDIVLAPEPTALALVGVAAVMLGRRRRA